MTPLAAVAAALAAAVRLAVPVIPQTPDHCGPAALAMVLSFYGADSVAIAGADRAYQPVLRGALITDLADCARRAGFPAEVATLTPDSLESLLHAGVPPVIYFRRGLGPLTRGHYVVVVGFDPGSRRYRLNDGGARTVTRDAAALVRKWRASGSQALVVRRRAP